MQRLKGLMQCLTALCVLLFLVTAGWDAASGLGPSDNWQIDPANWDESIYLNLSQHVGTSVEPSACTNGANDTLAVWSDARSGRREVYFIRLDWRGNVLTPGGQPRRLTQSTGEARSPCIAVHPNDDDRVCVVWSDNRYGNNEVFLKTSSDGGNVWSGDVRLSNDPSDSVTPSVGVDGHGRIHVVWSDNRKLFPSSTFPNLYRVRYAMLDWNGSPLISDVNLNPRHSNNFRPRIAVAEDGTAYVSWSTARDWTGSGGGKVDLVFILDTSGSMDDEWAHLNNKIRDIVSAVQATGVDLRVSVYGIAENKGAAYPDLRPYAQGMYEVYYTRVRNVPYYAYDPDGDGYYAIDARPHNEREDWAPGTGWVARRYPWRPGASRIVIPMSDECAWHGDYDPSSTQQEDVYDRDAVRDAIAQCVPNNVRVYPFSGQALNSQTYVDNEMAELAHGTGGRFFRWSTSADEVASQIVQIIITSAQDCAAVRLKPDLYTPGMPTDSASPWRTADLRISLASEAGTFTDIGFDAQGVAHIVWEQGTGVHTREVYYAAYDMDQPGTYVIAPVRLSNDNGAVSERPALAVDADGDVHVAWLDRRAGQEVYYAQVDPDYAPVQGTANVRVTSRTSHKCSEGPPDVVLTTEDVPALLFSDDLGGNWEVWYAHPLAPIRRIEVIPETAVVRSGYALSFIARGFDLFDNPVPFTPSWSWRSIPPNGGSGAIDATGRFVGIRTGNLTVVARDLRTGVEGLASVTVVPGDLWDFDIAPADPGLTADDSEQQFAIANATDANGNLLRPSDISTLTWTWTSSNASVGTFTAPGLLDLTHRAGSTDVTAGTTVTPTDGRPPYVVSRTILVVVRPGALAEIVLTPDPLVVDVDKTGVVTAIGQDRWGNRVTDLAPIWLLSSSNLGVLVPQPPASAMLVPGHVAYLQGTVTAVDPATGINGSAVVRLMPGDLARLIVYQQGDLFPEDDLPDPVEVTCTQSVQFEVMGLDRYDNPLEYAITPGECDWDATLGIGIVQTRGDPSPGLFTATRVGTGTVRVSRVNETGRLVRGEKTVKVVGTDVGIVNVLPSVAKVGQKTAVAVQIIFMWVPNIYGTISVGVHIELDGVRLVNGTKQVQQAPFSGVALKVVTAVLSDDEAARLTLGDHVIHVLLVNPGTNLPFDLIPEDPEADYPNEWTSVLTVIELPHAAPGMGSSLPGTGAALALLCVPLAAVRRWPRRSCRRRGHRAPPHRTQNERCDERFRAASP